MGLPPARISVCLEGRRWSYKRGRRVVGQRPIVRGLGNAPGSLGFQLKTMRRH